MASTYEWEKERLWVYAMAGEQTLRGHSFILRVHTVKSTELSVQKLEPALGGTSNWRHHRDCALSPQNAGLVGTWCPGLSEPRCPAASPQRFTGFHKTEGPGRVGTSLVSFSHFEDRETEAHGSSVLIQVTQPMSHDVEAQTHVTCSESGLPFFLNLFFHHKRKEDLCSSKTRAYIQKKTVLLSRSDPRLLLSGDHQCQWLGLCKSYVITLFPNLSHTQS